MSKQTPTNTVVQPLLNICDGLDAINSALGRAAAWLTGLMVLMQTGIILLRTGLNAGSLAAQDSVLYMHAALIMLCLAYTFKEQGHVRVDVFYHRFNPLTKAWINAIGNVVFLLPFAVFIIAISWDYALESWNNNEASGDAGGLDLVYFLKALIPLAGVLLFIQGGSDLLRNLVTISVKEE